MPTHWMDMSQVSFNALLLLERVQLSWFPGWLPETALATALKANPAVAWYMRHKCPDLGDWLDQMMPQASGLAKTAEVREAELTVLRAVDDLLVYALAPSIYDALPFLTWDSAELLKLTDFSGKIVIDVGAGTGRLTFIAAESAQAIYAVEPVANLRYFIQDKAAQLGKHNVYTLDGLITRLPFHPGFADITIGGHVFGDDPEAECAELSRVTGPTGMIILCPGNNDFDNQRHAFLVDHGFAWSRFEEPGDGMKRKYWKQKGVPGNAKTF